MLTAKTIEHVALTTVPLELVKSVPSAPEPFFSDLSTPAHIAELGQHLLSHDPGCLQYLFLLDAEQKLCAFMEVPQAEVSLIVRDVLRCALLYNAAAVVFCGLRSGDVVPRAGDNALFRQLSDAADAVGVPLFDHLLVGESEYCSYRELGRL